MVLALVIDSSATTVLYCIYTGEIFQEKNDTLEKYESLTLHLGVQGHKELWLYYYLNWKLTLSFSILNFSEIVEGAKHILSAEG